MPSWEGFAQTLAQWVARLSGTRPWHPGTATSAQLALQAAQPWLALAGTASYAAQAHYPPPDRNLLDAIPLNTPPPRQLPSHNQTASELCQHIPLTAERLRHAAFTFAADARWSPAATSLSWRRDALAAAITSHASELVLHTLAERASQLGLEPAFRTQLSTAADNLNRSCRQWRAVTSQWDILTTGAPRGSGITPVAAEIQDLVLQTGRIAYHNPQWTPAAADASPPRDAASLANTPDDAIAVLTAIHHATDAISRIATEDHHAVLAAADDNRICVPVRLLPDNYDIPQPYTLAPATHLRALLASYETAIKATTRGTIALDNLAAAVNAPSSILAIARRASATAHPAQRYQQDQRSEQACSAVMPIPGRTQQTLLKLQISDPALLLRAAVIDQAARDLLTEAARKAESRDQCCPSEARAKPAVVPGRGPIRPRSLPAGM